MRPLAGVSSVSFLNFFCLLMHVSLLCLCVKGGQH